MTITQLLDRARQSRCSDVHITIGGNPVFRIDGSLCETDVTLTRQETEEMLLGMLNETQKQTLAKGRDVDFCFTTAPGCRHRVNIYRQQDCLTAAIRVIAEDTPDFDKLNLPAVLRELARETRGLVLVTGPTGSGKSTTLAAMVDFINTHYAKHILTIEDPVEYVYQKKKSMVHQREVGTDTESISAALRSGLREDPDVVLVGEMRDLETISAVITAAETGHLVFSTLHTCGAADTIDRIIDVFPPRHQQQIRTQLAGVLKAVVTQLLLPRTDRQGRIAAFEVMTGTDAVRNLIRENKCHQLNSTMQMSQKQGMVTLDASLASLVQKGIVPLQSAMEAARDKNNFIPMV